MDLKAKAQALRGLASRLESLDRDIEAALASVLGFSPSIVAISPSLLEALVKEPPMTATEILKRRAEASAPVVPSLAFGQVIYFHETGRPPAPRFIVRDGKGDAVSLIGRDGGTKNTYASLEKLAIDVSIAPSSKMYSVNK